MDIFSDSLRQCSHEGIRIGKLLPERGGNLRLKIRASAHLTRLFGILESLRVDLEFIDPRLAEIPNVRDKPGKRLLKAVDVHLKTVAEIRPVLEILRNEAQEMPALLVSSHHRKGCEHLLALPFVADRFNVLNVHIAVLEALGKRPCRLVRDTGRSLQEHAERVCACDLPLVTGDRIRPERRLFLVVHRLVAHLARCRTLRRCGGIHHDEPVLRSRHTRTGKLDNGRSVIPVAARLALEMLVGMAKARFLVRSVKLTPGGDILILNLRNIALEKEPEPLQVRFHVAGLLAEGDAPVRILKAEKRLGGSAVEPGAA